MSIHSTETISYDQIKQAADYIQANTKYRPRLGLILGSGLGPLAAEVAEADQLPYHQIPYFPVSGVSGHAGKLVIGQLAGATVLVMQGRTHFYEGYSVQQITLPVRVMQLLGLETLIVTNAAGGINPSFNAGDLMLIIDQINLVGISGHSPLRGPNLDQFGPRFPNMTRAYDPALGELARDIATKSKLTLREGVYACVAGPAFETPAEIRFLKAIGADAVGMSTAPEVTVASHGGMRVLGISSITNMAVQESGSSRETTHEEVLETGKTIGPKLITLLKGILAELA